MFAHCPVDTVIPTLTFTKAELIYLISVLLKDVRDTDNSTRIELVEVRHYMNQIKDRVALALADGTIGRVLAHSEPKTIDDASKKPQEPVAPSMAELRQKFPSLSEEEIKEILDKAKEERQRERENEQEKMPPAPPSFIAKTIEKDSSPPPNETASLDSEEKKRRENSRKFVKMLGSL